MAEAFLFRYVFFDLLRLKRVLVWLLVAIGLFAVSKLWLNVSADQKDVEEYAMLSSLLVFRVLPLASAIFSAAVISQEIEQKTIVYLLTRPIPRPQILLMRTIASILVVALIGMACAISVSAAVYGNPFANEVLFRDLKSIFIGAAAYGSLFVLISLLINRSMVVSLLFAFAWETTVPNMPGNMYYLSISSYLTAISERPSAGSMTGQSLLGSLASSLGTTTISTQTAWIAMIGLTAFCIGLGMFWFRHFEYLPREDAE